MSTKKSFNAASANGAAAASARLSYGEQLKHPKWQRRRLECLEAAGWECGNCGCKDTTLHVHHKRYLKGRMAWEYGDAELEVLCETCHQAEHITAEKVQQVLAATHTASALALLSGYFGASDDGLDESLVEAGLSAGDPDSWLAGVVASMVSLLRPEQLLEVINYIAGLARSREIAYERAAACAAQIKKVTGQ